MKRSYPNYQDINNSNYPKGNFFNGTTLSTLKTLADNYAVQIELVVRPDGVRIKLIKKHKNNTIKTKSLEILNADMVKFNPYQIIGAMNEISSEDYFE